MSRTQVPAGRRGGEVTRPLGGQRILLAVVLTGSFMAVLDTTIVNVALPAIATGTGAQAADLEWVVSGYALAFGLALVPAGRVGDRFGYKQLFLAGLALFTVASVACGLAQSPAELIAARIVQGLGAGIYYPAISAVIQRAFTGRDRSRASAGWSSRQNQDFVLGSVPQRDAGTAGGTLITAQRIGAAIGIAVIGTALFGSGSSGGGGQGTSGQPQPQLLHTAPAALLAAVGFVLAALICGLFMPRRLGDERAEENT